MLKTYIYYSKTARAVEAVVAFDRTSADAYLLAALKRWSRLITDDYVLMTTVNLTEGSHSGFDIVND